MSKRRGRKKKRNIKKTLLKIFVTLAVIAGIFYFGGFMDMAKDMKQPEPELQIYNLNSDQRPVAVIIDNVRDAWPQVGLGDAFLIYEMLVEGGQTRLLAVFKDQETATIGPVRSARHYYLDYAVENDALFVHHGGSPQAYSDIRSLGINNLDGMAADGTYFKRDRSRRAPHNSMTSMESIWEYAKKRNLRLTTDVDPLLNYSVKNVSYEDAEDAKTANSIRINYSRNHWTSFEYNAETKLYSRSMRGVPHKDGITGAQYTARNIVIQKVRNTALSGANKGRQQLQNVGRGEGFYITNGFAIPITWEKSSRSARTVFKTKAGELIRINDGVTYIQIMPIDETVTIE